MRLLRLFPASVVLLISPAVIAQHSAAPSPSHTNPVVSHVSPTPSAGLHSSGVSSAHTVGATSRTGAAQASPAVLKENMLSAGRTKDTRLPVSATNAQPLQTHHFLFLRRHKPDKSKNSNRPLAPSVAAAPLPVAPSPHIGCTVVEVPLNRGIPCNPLAPCCP
jgi:hypothetical protein